MKRSEYIALGAVGVLIAVTFWPRSETPPIETGAKSLEQQDGFQTLAFASKEECLNAQILTATACDTEFRNAEPAALADAPKFDSMDKCTAEFGATGCKSASWNGASVFVPVLAGVLMARALNAGGQSSSQPLYPPRTGPAACPPGGNNGPECQSRNSGSSSSSSGSSGRYYSTGSGRSVALALGSSVVNRISPAGIASVGRGGGSWTTTRAVTAARVASTSSSSTTSRGGFGSTSRSHSSFGS